MESSRSGLVLVLLATVGSWTCRPRRDLHAVERLVPLSASPIDAGGDAGGAPVVLPRSATARRDAGVVIYVTDRPTPGGILGVRWGDARADIVRRNQAARVECRSADEYLFCPRALVGIPIPVVVTYEFCAGALCSVALDGARTRDETRLVADFDQLLGLVRAELGAPASQERRLAPGCGGHLPLCLTSKQSALVARWTWRGGAQAVVSADQAEDDALLALASTTVLSPERARRSDPDPGPYVPPGDADAADVTGGVDAR